MKVCHYIAIGVALLAMPAMATPTQSLTASRAPLPAAKPAKQTKRIVHPVLIKAKKLRAQRESKLKNPTKHLDLSGALKTGR